MKNNLLSYLFFTVYLFALIKPVIPVLDYIVNYDYIATQLCENRDKPILDCNGKCYVAKEIKESNTQHEHLLISVVEFEKYTVEDFQFNLKLELVNNITNARKFYYLENFSDAFLSKLLRPPIV